MISHKKLANFDKSIERYMRLIHWGEGFDMLGYVFLGVCFIIAMVALWKGDALVGLGVLGGCMLVYWITLDRLSLDWLR